MQFRGAYKGLLAIRGLAQPDGRPLFRYRFLSSEYEGTKALLKTQKSSLYGDIYGFALLVMFVAEWYRRDRTGGHWDWIRPLGEIGIAYDSNSARSELAYSQLRYMVEQGLGLWKRPLISRGQPLYSLVGEAGFPVAALQESRLGVWLRRSVLAIEKGALPEDAVANESRRISDQHTQVMFEAAVDLCRVTVALRKSLGQNRTAKTDEQLIALLDRSAAGWRDELPFDVGDKGFFALFRDLMDAQGEAAAPTRALRAVRTIKKANDGSWKPFASVSFTGRVALSDLVPSLASILAETDRARLIGRGAWAEFSHPLAALEKWHDGGQDNWEVRPLMRDTLYPLELSQDVFLGAAVSGRAIVEFVPAGGQALTESVIAFKSDSTDLRDVNELEAIGSTSARVQSSWLVLAISNQMPNIQFDGETIELGPLGSHYRLVGFSGKAKYEVDGIRTDWSTGADRDQIIEVGVTGDTANSTKGSIFIGCPTIWLSRDGLVSKVLDRNVRWRTSGMKAWRRLTDAEPLGSVELAVVRQDDIVATVRVRALPKNVRLEADKRRRVLVIEGHAGAVVSGTKDKPLPVSRAGDAIFVDLSTHPRGENVELEFRWDNSISLSLLDPFSEPLLLAPSGRPHPRRGLIAIGRLKGYRLLSPHECRLHLESRNRTEVVVAAVATISGSSPLMSLEPQLRELMGSAASIDARVRLIWEGQSDWVAEIGWYDLPEGIFPVVGARSATISAISISEPAVSIANLAQEEKWVLQGRLALEASPGPWLVFGRTSDGATVRPRFVPMLVAEPDLPSSAEPTTLERCINLPTFAERRHSLAKWASEPERWSASDVKRVIGMCRAARSHRVPFNTFDTLEVLSDHLVALPHLLASCLNHDERADVLALQSELPFLWCTTPLSSWIDAYEAATERLSRRLVFMEDKERACESRRSIAKVLSQISDLEPGVGPHVAALLRMQFSLYLDGIDLRHVTSGAQNLRTCADAFVSRHGDRHSDCEVGVLATLVKRYPAFWERYDQVFWDAITAPIVAAQMAAGQIHIESRLVRKLRSVWHLDRDYFESMFAVAMSNEASMSTHIGGNK